MQEQQVLKAGDRIEMDVLFADRMRRLIHADE